jgi:ABC-type transport system involved in resistance to organic solvents, auxiliary component
MKKISFLVLFITFFFHIALKAYSTDPEQFVQELVNDAISKLSDKNLTKEEKQKFIENIAIDNVDVNALGLYTLGEIRKTSEKTSLTKYQKTFEKYFLKSLTSRLSDYSSSRFEVISSDKKSASTQ